MPNLAIVEREPSAPEYRALENAGGAPVLSAHGLAKTYRVYARPIDRPRQALFSSTPSQYYTEFKALAGVSFEIQPGEAVVFIGRNGAGKSTLLQIVSGIMWPRRRARSRFAARSRPFSSSARIAEPSDLIEWRPHVDHGQKQETGDEAPWGLTFTGPLQKPSPVLPALGVISYGIYLYHLMVRAAIDPFGITWPPELLLLS